MRCGSMLAVGGDGGQVMLVDAATGKVRWSVQAHAGTLGSAREAKRTQSRVAMSPDGRLVASVGVSDANWKLWDAANGAEWLAGLRHDGTGSCICGVSKSGRHSSFDAGCPVNAHTCGLLAVVFSPCGQRLATGGKDGVRIWDSQTGKAEHRMQGAVWSLSFSAEGARLAGGGWDVPIRVWDVTTGALLHTMPQIFKGYPTRVYFSPSKSRILASTTHDTPHSHNSLWDVESGEKLETFAGSSFAAFSPDGRTIATTSAGSSMCDMLLLDSDTGTLRLSMICRHKGEPTSASWSVDGRKLASGGYDGTCKVWNSSTGALLKTITLGLKISSMVWGCDWVLDTQRTMAFAMGQHFRLGAESQVLALDEEVVRMVLDRVL